MNGPPTTVDEVVRYVGWLNAAAKELKSRGYDVTLSLVEGEVRLQLGFDTKAPRPNYPMQTAAQSAQANAAHAREKA